MKRVVVTGSSGYLGRKLVSALRAQGHVVLGVDVTEADTDQPDEFVESDIRNYDLTEPLREFKPTAIIHCAFVIKQLRNSSEMSDINVGGTQNILRVADDLKPQQFLFLSSATAFGAWPDNPVPIPDGTIPKGRWTYQYSGEKADLEKEVQKLSDRHPQMAVSWVRPSIVGGPRMDNFLGRFIFGLPFLMKLDGFDQPLQFVHEDDVIAGIMAVLDHNARGGFNLAPPSHTALSEIGTLTGRRTFSIPFWLGYASSWLAWKTRFWLHESPPGFLYFARYPWVVSPDRLTEELGFEFTRTSSETVEESFRSMK